MFWKNGILAWCIYKCNINLQYRILREPMLWYQKLTFLSFVSYNISKHNYLEACKKFSKAWHLTSNSAFPALKNECQSWAHIMCTMVLASEKTIRANKKNKKYFPGFSNELFNVAFHTFTFRDVKYSINEAILMPWCCISKFVNSIFTRSQSLIERCI